MESSTRGNRRVTRRDPGRDAASRCKAPDDFHLSGTTRGDEIIKDRVNRVFVENPSIAKTKQIELEAFQLDDGFTGRIGNDDRGEIGLACFGTHRRKFRAGDLDFVVTIRKLVGKRLQRDHRDRRPCPEAKREVGEQFTRAR